MDQKRLLIVEDEGIVAADLADRLERLGYIVIGTAASADEALASASSLAPDLVLMDIVLQGPQNGITAAKRIRDALDIPIIFLTSHADTATVHSAVGATPFGYVLKPFNERELQTAIEIGLYRHQTESKLRKMERWLATPQSSIADAVIATDTAGRVTMINSAAQRMTGWADDKAIGQPLELVFPAVDAVSHVPLTGLVERALVEGFSIGIAEHAVAPAQDAPEVPIDDSIAPVRDEQGQAIGVVVVFRDATQRHGAQALVESMLETAAQQQSGR
ncbi:MAG: response regulator [Betaproteobacteria bacterium]